MEIIKEPLDVDFFFENRGLTPKEEKMISEYIRALKAKAAKQKSKSKNTSTKKTPTSKK